MRRRPVYCAAVTRWLAPGIAWLAALLLAAPARAEPPVAAAPALATIVVIAEGLDEVALRDALALRVPTARITGQVQKDMPCGEGCALAQVRRAGEGLRIEVQLADGRVFARTWAEDVAEPERAAATSLAHLLAAIEDGTAEPEVVASPPPPSEVVAPSETRPSGENLADLPPRKPAVEAAAPAPLPPRVEIGPTVGLAAVFGVGPPAGLAGLCGSGGFVGAGLRHRSGFLAALELRWIGARDSGFRLGRLRTALGLGYGLRRGLFELRALAAFTVEPWWVGARADGAARQSGAPLLGGAFTLAPGLGAELQSGVRLHVGLRLEVAASAPPGALATLQLRDPFGEALFRLGGAEISVGAEIGVRWGSRR